MARGPGFEQGEARRIARLAEGIAIGARPRMSSTGWIIGGWASGPGERWLVILPNGQYLDAPEAAMEYAPIEEPCPKACSGGGLPCGLGEGHTGDCDCGSPFHKCY